ncbi:MAG: hypothetical protein P4L98_20250 [Ancalomicrobiaceae bacterium]|nr:hypothetical protein [Ancalomicrobiaceae bacterium]
MILSAPAVAPVRILAWIHLFLGSVGLLAGSALCLALYQVPSPRSLTALQFVGPFFLMAAILYLVPAFIGGLGLLTGKSWAWVPIIFISVLLLPMIPIGTALGGFGFWALANRRRTAGRIREQGGEPIPLQPRLFRLGSTGKTLLTMAGTGSGFVVVLDVGFQLHQQVPPVILSHSFFPATATILLALGYVAVRLMAAPTTRALPPIAPIPPTKHQQLSLAQKAFADERRLRLGIMAADPERRQYAARIEAGEGWSDDRIAYHQDPGRTATCTHLQPIERAMRAAGLDLRLDRDLTVIAPCTINEARLREFYQPGPTVHYGAIPDSGRSYEDPPSAALKCDACKSLIYVIHPLEAGVDRSLRSWPP